MPPSFWIFRTIWAIPPPSVWEVIFWEKAMGYVGAQYFCNPKKMLVSFFKSDLPQL